MENWKAWLGKRPLAIKRKFEWEGFSRRVWLRPVSSVSNFAHYQEEAGIASAPFKCLCRGQTRLKLLELILSFYPFTYLQVYNEYLSQSKSSPFCQSFLFSSREKFCVAAFFLWNGAGAATRQSVDGARSNLRFTKMRHRDTGAGWSEPQRYSSQSVRAREIQ